MVEFRSAFAVLAATVFAAISSLSGQAAAWSSISVSRTLNIDGQPYYLPVEPIASLSNAPVSGEVLPFTTIVTSSGTITSDTIKSALASYKASDDVFTDSFLRGVLIIGKGSSTVSSSATTYLAKLGVEKLIVSGVSSFSTSGKIPTTKVSGINLSPGPYVLAKDVSGSTSVYEPYKLYYDETQSFYKSVHPLKNGTFAVVSASLDTDSSPYIGVPSKIYATSKDKSKYPLAGVRVTVKDIYFIKGIIASCGNRAFYQTYGIQNVTGPAVQRLIDQGANIVGTTKTVQFANGDRATADWVDYHASFVLRGDGYREPSGSSTGGGSSTSAHDWLDVGIGSDTGGSIRGPSGANGIYGIRPSVGAIDLDHVMPLSDILDTGGYMTRDPKLFQTFGKSWYGENTMFKSYPSFPKTLLLAPSFESVSEPAMEVYNSFFTKLQDFLGATIANYSIADNWNQTSGISTPVATYLNATYPTLIAFHQWSVLGSKLFKDYAAVNGGRNPHINPAVLSRWNYGISRGEDGYNEEMVHQKTFENWTMNNFLLEDAKSCSQSIYLYPQSAGSYSSRETYFNVSSPPFGFSDGRVAVHARSPDAVVPIGQISYNSTISGIQEVLPVTVSLVARRGCDFMLMDLISALADKGIVQTVKTGRTAY